MMGYWSGNMNWPIKSGWVCETCKTYVGMTWGMAHAQCRCNCCHTEYRMRNDADEIVDIPIVQMKEEYKEPARLGWTKYRKPVDEFTDDDWDAVMLVQSGKDQP